MENFFINIIEQSLSIVAFGLRTSLLFLFFLTLLYFFNLFLKKTIESINKKHYLLWTAKISEIVKTESPTKLIIKRSQETGFTQAIIDLYEKEKTKKKKDVLKNIYIQSNLYPKDIYLLTHRIKWWKILQILDKVRKLNLTSLEKEILPYIYSKNLEIKYMSIKVLASLSSTIFFNEIENLYKKSSRWTFLYITSVLSSHNIPLRYISPLAQSSSKHTRKAAAIILGNYDTQEAFSMLKKLSNDSLKDIRREAILSLGEIGTQEALEIIEEKMEDNNIQIKTAALKATYKIAPDKFIKHINELESKKHFDMKFLLDKELKELSKQQ